MLKVECCLFKPTGAQRSPQIPGRNVTEVINAAHPFKSDPKTSPAPLRDSKYSQSRITIL